MSFFDDFMGRSGRRDLQQYSAQADGLLTGGYNRAVQQGERLYNEGQNFLSPFAQGGRDADAMIRNALGLNGADAQRGYYSGFQTDPGFQSEVQAGVNALDRSATARGGLYSGAAMKAVQGYGQQKMGQAYGNRLNALMQYGQQGQQAAGQQAQMASQYGGDRMNLEYGYGQQQAGNRINLGNAMAANRNVGINNLLGIAGTAAKAAAAFSDIRLKRDIEQVGELPSGLPVYSFKYVWSEIPHVGVMAQEAAKLFPQAVMRHQNGYLMVDYSQIG